MNQIKVTFLVALVSITAFPAFKPQLVKMRSVDGGVVTVRSESVEAAYAALAARDIGVISARAEVTGKATELGYSSSGLNLSSTDAAAFGESIGKNAESADQAATVKAAIEYAYKSRGMNLNSKDARVWVEKLFSSPSPDQRLEIHRNAFKLAYSTLNMSTANANAYADKHAGLCE